MKTDAMNMKGKAVTKIMVTFIIVFFTENVAIDK